MPPDLEQGDEQTIPDLEKAVERGYASFSQLVDADWRREGHGRAASAYRQLFAGVRDAFESTHGTIEDDYSLRDLRCYVARTSAAPRAAGAKGKTIPKRARQSDFHFVYDLARIPVGGDILTRIEMLASDATRLLRREKLIGCLDQLYSKTTDALGVINRVVDHRAQVRKAATAAAAAAPAAPGAPPPAPAEDPTTAMQEQLDMIRHDLSVIELKYMITDARLKYFQGAVLSTLLICAVVFSATLASPVVDTFKELGRSFALAVVFGTFGALVSVVQRMNSDSLDVRYDLGISYTVLLGALRPLIGAFAGVLVWLLVNAQILTNTTKSDFFLAAIAFTLGIAERSLGDVVTQSGILNRLAPAKAETAASAAPATAPRAT
jgi:hypothetical protein